MSELDILLLRFDAPLMSFGGVAVDERGVIDETPGLSLVTGLIANALGWHHRDHLALARLQERLRLATRRDRAGVLLDEFQTVDLGQPNMEPGWTTWHQPATRGGANSRATHIRRRQFWADAVFTLALTVDPATEEPDLDAVERALLEPERPLFLGRKSCLPADRLVIGRRRAPTLKHAVATAPLPRPAGRADTGRAETAGTDTAGSLTIWWPEGDAPAPDTETGDRQPVYDLRDWANQVHTGRRFVYRGTVPLLELADGD